MNSDELKELLRLTAIALGDGWSVIETARRNLLLHNGKLGMAISPHSDNADSRWLECELGLCIVRYKEEVSTYHPSSDVTVVLQVAQFSGMLEATRWAVLQCAAEIGKAKEVSA